MILFDYFSTSDIITIETIIASKSFDVECKLNRKRGMGIV